MSKRIIFILLSGICLCILAWIITRREANTNELVPFHSSSEPSPATTLKQNLPRPNATSSTSPGLQVPNSQDMNEAKLKIIAPLFIAPLHVNGRVIDQDGTAVVGATIEAGIQDVKSQLYGSNKLITTNTDNEGHFVISTIGFCGTIATHKAGYHSTDKSRAQINSGQSSVTLELKKIKSEQPLIHVSFELNLDRTGTKQSVNILKSIPNIQDQALLEFQCWIDMQGEIPLTFVKYPWHVRVGIPGGGLQPCLSEDATEAPVDGYQTEQIINSGSLPKWSDRTTSNLFVQFPDQKYAKLSVQFIVGRNQFVHIDAYYNPSGSRSLDFDPDIQINK